MNDHKQRKKILRGEWLLTTLIAVLLLATLVFSNLTRPLGNVLYDHLIRLQGFRTTENIVIVAIDDHSIQEHGSWPIQRSTYTRLLAQLNDDCCRPKSIGFDLLFLDPTKDDEEFAAQLNKHNSVLPLFFNINEQDQEVLLAQKPVSPLDQSANLAHINLTFDPDGVIRGFHTKEQIWPHFSLAMHGEKDYRAPQNEHKRFRMVDPSIGFPMLSLTDALNSKANRTLLRDKYVLIGVTSPSLGDRYPTLYSGKNNASTPGVAILASVLNASLSNSFIHVAPTWAVFIVTLLPLLYMLHSLLVLSPRYALGLAITITLGAISISLTLIKTSNYWIDPTPLIVIVLVLQPLWAWRRLEAIVRFVQDAATELRQFQSNVRANQTIRPSREVVLQHAKLLDQAVASARSELIFLAAIIDEMPDSIMIFDARERLLLCNQKIRKLFNNYHFTEGSDISTFAKHIQTEPSDIFDSGQKYINKEVIQLETSLGKRDFIIKGATLQTPAANAIGIAIFTDVTELKQSQRQRDRALQFLSHDMRTPIASILSIVQISKSHTESQAKIKQHAKTLLNMTDDFILTISAEATQYVMQQVLLDNLINDALDEVSDLANAKEITINEIIEVDDIFITANPRLLLRVFINLIYNAIKFSPEKSIIRIRIYSYSGMKNERDQITIEISNLVATSNISTDLISLTPGFGLGLNFVESVIHRHDGSLERAIPTSGMAIVKVNLPYKSQEML